MTRIIPDRKHRRKKTLVVLLSAVLALNSLVISAYADENGIENGASVSDESMISDNESDEGEGAHSKTVTTSTEHNGNETVTKTTETEQSVSGAGTLEDPKKTETKTTTTETITINTGRENQAAIAGNTTTTVVTETEQSGTNMDGAQVDSQKTETETTVMDGQGRPVSESGSESGTETITDTSTTTDTQIQELPEQSFTETTDGTPATDTQYTEWEEIAGDNSPTTEAKNISVGYGGDVTVSLTPGQTNTVSNATDEAVLATQHLTAPGTSSDTTTGENGETIETVVTVEEIKDGDRVIGYTTTTTVTTTTELDKTEEQTDGEIRTSTTNGEAATEVTTTTAISLPEKPQAGETVDTVTGQKTVVKVEDVLDERGNIVGYQSITEITDAAGNHIGGGVETVWGNTTTTTTTVTIPVATTTEKDTKVTTTTTTAITKGITTSGVQIIATDREVTATMSAVSRNGEHGNVDMTSLAPTQAEPAPGTADTGTDLYHRPDKTEVNTELGEYDYLWKGEYGLESAIRIDDVKEGENTWQAHQFVLVDKDGQKHYVYCADFEVDPVNGFRYDMENVEDASYYSSDNAKSIRAIAENGYWGTDSGAGSLQAVKDMLTKAVTAGEINLSQNEIDSLTPGEALTATQGAIWYYGNSGKNNINKDDIVGKYYNGSSFMSNYSNETVQALFEYLIGLSKDAEPETTLINENHITGSEITVGTKAEGVAANEDADDTNDVYNTCVKFTLAVIPSGDGDTLTVQVIDQNGKPVATRRLTGIDGDDRISPDESGTFTVTGLQLAENVAINLKLSGTQHLAQGVYLYTSEVRTGEGLNGDNLTSQTFVGIADGTREVDLNVTLSFNVDEPTAQIVKTESEQEFRRQGTEVSERTDTTTKQAVTAHMVITTDVTDKVQKEWHDEWARTYEYRRNDDNDDGGSSGGGRNEKSSGGKVPDSVSVKSMGTTDEEEIFETKEVPLGMLPKTGDRFWYLYDFWCFLVGLTGMGAASSILHDEERRKEKR